MPQMSRVQGAGCCLPRDSEKGTSLFLGSMHHLPLLEMQGRSIYSELFQGPLFHKLHIHNEIHDGEAAFFLSGESQ